MNPLFAVPTADLASLAPELLLTAAATVLLLLEAFAPALRRAFVPAGLAATIGAAWLLTGSDPGPAFHGLVESSPLTREFSLTVLLATALGLLAAPGYLRRARLLAGEYPALILWCCGSPDPDPVHRAADPLPRARAVLGRPLCARGLPSALGAYVMGAVYPTVPAGAMSINKGGTTYYLSGNTWFQPSYGANGVYYRVVPTP